MTQQAAGGYKPKVYVARKPMGAHIGTQSSKLNTTRGKKITASSNQPN